MRRLPLSGAMYGDAAVTGEYAVLYPKSRFGTHLGDLPFPQGEAFGILYPRITNVYPFRIAGQPHDSTGWTAKWVLGEGWKTIPVPAFGVSPCIFDNAGALSINPVGGPTQGFRYVDRNNVVIDGDATYAPRFGLSEWSDLFGWTSKDGKTRDLIIGQGQNGGALIWDGFDHRLLEPGDTHFIRAARTGDNFAFAISKFATNEVVLIWCTLQELFQLPVVGTVKIDREPGPVHVDSSPVVKESAMPVAPNKLDALKSIAQFHPEIDRMADGPFAPNRGGITQLAAQQFGLPFGRKSRDGNKTNLSDDALCYRLGDGSFEIYDILSGGDGGVQWNYVGTFRDGENGFFVSVGGPVLGPTDPPAPPTPSSPPAPQVDLTPLLNRLTALESKVANLESGREDAADRMSNLNNRAIALENARYRVRGKSEVSFGHQHVVNLIVEVVKP